MPSNLEKEYHLPDSKARCRVSDNGSDLAVILTHPWGPLGGNMHNNVVTAAALYFQRLRVTTMRMDFRGSQISRGTSEVKQVVEAADFLLSGRHLHGGDQCSAVVETGAAGSADSDKKSSAMGWDPRTGRARPQIETGTPLRQHRAPTSILLVGYSYGSLIAASASAGIPRCVGCVSVAPPISVKHWLLLFNSSYHIRRAMERADLPRLMVMGSEDDFTSEAQFQDFVASFPADSTTGAMLKGANHFYGGRERDLMNVVGNWLLCAYSSVLGNDLKRLGYVDFSSYGVSPGRDLTTKLSEDTKESTGSYSLSSILGATDCACVT